MKRLIGIFLLLITTSLKADQFIYQPIPQPVYIPQPYPVPGPEGVPGKAGTDGLNGRDGESPEVSGLFETKWLIDTEIRIGSSQYVDLSLYNRYDWRHFREDSIGVKLGIKIGESWEERQIERLQKEIEMIMEERK